MYVFTVLLSSDLFTKYFALQLDVTETAKAVIFGASPIPSLHWRRRLLQRNHSSSLPRSLL